MTKDKQVSVILAKVFNCGASQCMSIYTEKDTLTPEQALIDLNQTYMDRSPTIISVLKIRGITDVDDIADFLFKIYDGHMRTSGVWELAKAIAREINGEE